MGKIWGRGGEGLEKGWERGGEEVRKGRGRGAEGKGERQEQGGTAFTQSKFKHQPTPPSLSLPPPSPSPTFNFVLPISFSLPISPCVRLSHLIPFFVSSQSTAVFNCPSLSRSVCRSLSLPLFSHLTTYVIKFLTKKGKKYEECYLRGSGINR